MLSCNTEGFKSNIIIKLNEMGSQKVHIVLKVFSISKKISWKIVDT